MGFYYVAKTAPTRCKRKPHPLAIALVRNVIGWGPNQLHEIKNRKQIKGYFAIMTVEGETKYNSTWITSSFWRLDELPQQLTPIFARSYCDTVNLHVKKFFHRETFPPHQEIFARISLHFFIPLPTIRNVSLIYFL